jgi:hypothetical protein
MSVTEAARVDGSWSICAGERRSGQFCISALHGPSIWVARAFSVRGWIQDAAFCRSAVSSTGEQPICPGSFPVKRKRVCTWVRCLSFKSVSALNGFDGVFGLGCGCRKTWRCWALLQWVAASLLAALLALDRCCQSASDPDSGLLCLKLALWTWAVAYLCEHCRNLIRVYQSLEMVM